MWNFCHFVVRKKGLFWFHCHNIWLFHTDTVDCHLPLRTKREKEKKRKRHRREREEDYFKNRKELKSFETLQRERVSTVFLLSSPPPPPPPPTLHSSPHHIRSLITRLQSLSSDLVFLLLRWLFPSRYERLREPLIHRFGLQAPGQSRPYVRIQILLHLILL